MTESMIPSLDFLILVPAAVVAAAVAVVVAPFPVLVPASYRSRGLDGGLEVSSCY